MVIKVDEKIIYIEDTYIIHNEDDSSKEAFDNKEIIESRFKISLTPSLVEKVLYIINLP